MHAADSSQEKEEKKTLSFLCFQFIELPRRDAEAQRAGVDEPSTAANFPIFLRYFFPLLVLVGKNFTIIKSAVLLLVLFFLFRKQKSFRVGLISV